MGVRSPYTAVVISFGRMSSDERLPSDNAAARGRSRQSPGPSSLTGGGVSSRGRSSGRKQGEFRSSRRGAVAEEIAKHHLVHHQPGSGGSS